MKSWLEYKDLRKPLDSKIIQNPDRIDLDFLFHWLREQDFWPSAKDRLRHSQDRD